VPESVTLSTLGIAGEQAQVSLEISDNQPVGIKMSDDELGTVEFNGVDLFDCLINVRKLLELNGRLLCCQGASSSVIPSGMTRQMTNGRLAYRLRSDGAALSDDDLVDIFAPAECSEVVDVAEQRRTVISSYAVRRNDP
jgi:hypothetical protein